MKFLSIITLLSATSFLLAEISREDIYRICLKQKQANFSRQPKPDVADKQSMEQDANFTEKLAAMYEFCIRLPKGEPILVGSGTESQKNGDHSLAARFNDESKKAFNKYASARFSWEADVRSQGNSLAMQEKLEAIIREYTSAMGTAYSFYLQNTQFKNLD